MCVRVRAHIIACLVHKMLVLAYALYSIGCISVYVYCVRECVRVRGIVGVCVYIYVCVRACLRVRVWL